MTIVADDDVLHGHPRIEGTRIGVIHVSDMVVTGADPSDVADALDVPLGRVYVALAYYYDPSEELRALRGREDDALDEPNDRTVDPPVEARDAS